MAADPVEAGALVSTWTPVAIAAFGSLALGIYNFFVGERRERGKVRREEFNRRVSTPIEAAVSDFRKAEDVLVESTIPISVDDIDAAAKAARSGQRQLSRVLKYAASSQFCSGPDFANIGNDEFDAFIESLEMLRISTAENQERHRDAAVSAAVRLVDQVHRAIDAELGKYA